MRSGEPAGQKVDEGVASSVLIRAVDLTSQNGHGANSGNCEDPNVMGGELRRIDENADTTSQSANKDEARIRAMRDLITGAQMSVKIYPPEHFLIGPKLLPFGGRMLLTAETGTGKSAIALHIAACIITGSPLFGLLRARKDANHGQPFFPIIKPTDVLYLDFELPEHIRWEQRLRPLSKHFGTNFLDRIYFPKRPSELRLDPGNGFEKLRNLVSTLKPGVTIIDPLSSTHSVDENTNALKQPLNKIDQLIDETGTTVILIHHASAKKARTPSGQLIEKDARERPRGHTCLLDWADVHIHLETLDAKLRQRYDEEDEGANPTNELSLQFGKTRYCETPKWRKIEADIGDMYFGRPHGAPTATASKNQGGALTPAQSTS